MLLVFDQTDLHAEIAVFFDKSPRSVNRVNHPDAVSGRANFHRSSLLPTKFRRREMPRLSLRQ